MQEFVKWYPEFANLMGEAKLEYHDYKPRDWQFRDDEGWYWKFRGEKWELEFIVSMDGETGVLRIRINMCAECLINDKQVNVKCCVDREEYKDMYVIQTRVPDSIPCVLVQELMSHNILRNLKIKYDRDEDYCDYNIYTIFTNDTHVHFKQDITDIVSTDPNLIFEKYPPAKSLPFLSTKFITHVKRPIVDQDWYGWSWIMYGDGWDLFGMEKLHTEYECETSILLTVNKFKIYNNGDMYIDNNCECNDVWPSSIKLLFEQFQKGLQDQ